MSLIIRRWLIAKATSTLLRASWASGPAAPKICALLISTKGIEDINVSTHSGGEVAVHAGSSRTFMLKKLTVLSTCSTPVKTLES